MFLYRDLQAHTFTTSHQFIYWMRLRNATDEDICAWYDVAVITNKQTVMYNIKTKTLEVLKDGEDESKYDSIFWIKL